jgi:hypothetical protein
MFKKMLSVVAVLALSGITFGADNVKSSIDAFAAVHGGQTCAVAEMREDHTAVRGRGIEAAEFLHQIGVGQAVEAVAFDALCRIAPRNRQ